MISTMTKKQKCLHKKNAVKIWQNSDYFFGNLDIYFYIQDLKSALLFFENFFGDSPIFSYFRNKQKKLTLFDVAIQLTLPYTSGWV